VVRFTREQAELVVDAILCGAVDQIQSSLPPVIDREEGLSRRAELGSYVQGVVNTTGGQLAVLFARLTGEGMGVGDYSQFAAFEAAALGYLERQLGDDPDQAGTFPDMSHLGRAFVGEYLV
jgi:hypothetical protein